MLPVLALLPGLFACCSGSSSPARTPSVPARPATATPAPPIRVRLRSLIGNRTNRIEVDGPYRLVSLPTGKLIDSGTSLNRDLRTAGASISEARRLIPENRRFRLGGRPYRGTLRMEPGQLGVDLMVETDLESYLPGVLEAELGASFPPAALRAQAIAARTYALHKTSIRGPTRSFDVADDQSDQVYRGTPLVAAGPLFEAVAGTRGMILKSAGKPLPAYFHSTCGGHTAAAHDVFGGAPILSLPGVPCRYCEGSRTFRWSVPISLSQAGKALGMAGKLRDISIGKTDRGGRARTFVLTGDRTVERSAAEVRMALGPALLRSTLILSIKISGSEIRFEGGGFGHGVGLCQMGARGMALQGAAASDILGHYYPGAKLVRRY